LGNFSRKPGESNGADKVVNLATKVVVDAVRTVVVSNVVAVAAEVTVNNARSALKH
jgi:hypothetical protein